MTKPTKENWEIEFEKIFAKRCGEQLVYVEKAIKAFINSLLSQQLEEIEGKIKELRGASVSPATEEAKSALRAYNGAIDNVLSSLRQDISSKEE